MIHKVEVTIDTAIGNEGTDGWQKSEGLRSIKRVNCSHSESSYFHDKEITAHLTQESPEMLTCKPVSYRICVGRIILSNVI